MHPRVQNLILRTQFWIGLPRTIRRNDMLQSDPDFAAAFTSWDDATKAGGSAVADAWMEAAASWMTRSCCGQWTMPRRLRSLVGRRSDLR